MDELSGLNPAPYNPRIMTGAGQKELQNSIAMFGDLSGLVYNDYTGNIVGGHQRKEAYAEKGGHIEITERLDKPNSVGTIARGFVVIGDEKYTYRVVSWPLEMEQKANLAANKIQGEWDDQALAELMYSIKDDPQLHATGFDTTEITQLLATVSDVGQEEEDADLTPPPPAEIVTKPGDLIELGDHRLFCGDSTNPEHLAILMANNQAEMVFTDPPYNIDYDGGASGDWAKKKRRAKFANDKKSPEAFQRFLESTITNMLTNTRGALYICGHASSLHLLFNAFAAAGGKWSSWIIWAKHHYTLTNSDYQHQYEPVLYGLTEGEAAAADNAEEGQYDATPILYGWARHKWYGGRKQGDVWLIDRLAKNENHPTEKPVAVPAKAIRNSSKRGDIVLDLFGGSGSTLIAADQLQRRAYLMEIDPGFCDVIIRRWEQLTGNKSRIIRNYGPTTEAE